MFTALRKGFGLTFKTMFRPDVKPDDVAEEVGV